MANKNKKSPFYWYMKEMQEDAQARGQKIPGGMAGVADFARPGWNAMTAEEKKPYEAKAREYKNSQFKLDNYHNVIHLRTDPVQEYETLRCKEIEAVKSKWPTSRKDVGALKFYFINFQVLGNIEVENGSSFIYLPAEVAAAEFSLLDGITNTFHEFLKPPPIPMGSRYVCVAHSDATHKISLEGHAECTSDYATVYRKLIAFANPAQDEDAFPFNPFYVPMSHFDCATYCLNWLHSQAYQGAAEVPHRVHELEGLLIALTANATGKAISKTTASEILHATEFDFDPGTKCEYHDSIECIHCSLSIVKRFCFTISQFLCDKYGIPLTGCHIPCLGSGANVEMKPPVVDEPSDESGWEKQKSRQSKQPRPAGQTSSTNRQPWGDRPWSVAGAHTPADSMTDAIQSALSIDVSRGACTDVATRHPCYDVAVRSATPAGGRGRGTVARQLMAPPGDLTPGDSTSEWPALGMGRGSSSNPYSNQLSPWRK